MANVYKGITNGGANRFFEKNGDLKVAGSDVGGRLTLTEENFVEEVIRLWDLEISDFSLFGKKSDAEAGVNENPSLLSKFTAPEDASVTPNKVLVGVADDGGDLVKFSGTGIQGTVWGTENTTPLDLLGIEGQTVVFKGPPSNLEAAIEAAAAAAAGDAGAAEDFASAQSELIKGAFFQTNEVAAAGNITLAEALADPQNDDVKAPKEQANGSVKYSGEGVNGSLFAAEAFVFSKDAFKSQFETDGEFDFDLLDVSDGALDGEWIGLNEKAANNFLCFVEAMADAGYGEWFNGTDNSGGAGAADTLAAANAFLDGLA